MTAHLLGHLANVLFGASYLVRSLLWLRILSVVACVSAAGFNYLAPAAPLWVAIHWNLFFVVVNLVSIRTALRRRRERAGPLPLPARIWYAARRAPRISGGLACATISRSGSRFSSSAPSSRSGRRPRRSRPRGRSA